MTGRPIPEDVTPVNGEVDIVHLTDRPPFLPGSFNRMVAAQIKKITEFRQVAISYWEDRPPREENFGESLITVNGKGLSLWQRAYLRFPERIRQIRFNAVGGRESLIYTWQVLKILPLLRPKIVVCYDGYKLGPLLRGAIDWPCRLVLSQRGLSYYLPQTTATGVYSLNSFDVIWTLTRASYRADRQRMPAYEPLVKVLPNGIDVEEFKPVSATEKANLRAKWGLPEDRLIVILLSRMVPKKGAHVILHSWPKILSEIPNAYLWIVGGANESYAQYLIDMAKALGVSENVRIQGAVSPDLTASCYQAADLYVFPTLFVEGFGLSLAEAMSCRLACIVSDHDVARELYSDQEVLFVQDPNLEDAFVEPIVRLLRDESLRERLGTIAMAAVRERFDQGKIFTEVREFYRRQISLVNGKQ